MKRDNKRLGLFPGTFDPITYGHLDVIERAAKLFDELVVGVGDNPAKASLLDQQTRAGIVRQAAGELSNVRVETFSGLTVDLARALGAAAIVRGLRTSADLNAELQMAMTNRAAAGIETVFVVTAAEYAYISSSLIKQIAQNGGDISGMVPPQVIPHIQRTHRSK
ncbi:MAG: pantetheine-phosphate adenylyltransferase [Phycisphaerae bacterium]|nr:pantetheine-phosphate adenylyltransferase [Phycisphaerae bacterium]